MDVALTIRPTGQTIVTLPITIGRALVERGYNRCRIEITDDGILLHPYVSNETAKEPKATLPEWEQ